MLLTRDQDGFTSEELQIKGYLNRGLAKQELRSLMLRATGLTAKESSKELNCSVATENKRMQTINFKLKAKNATHAVGIAIKKGIISYLMLATLCVSMDVDFEESSEPFRHQTTRLTVRIQARTRRREDV